MFLTKSNLIISLCFFASFCATRNRKKPRFSKIGNNYFLHLFFDDDRLEFEKIEVQSGRGCGCSFKHITSDFPLKTQLHRLANELIIDISGLEKNDTHEYIVNVYTERWGVFRTELFSFYTMKDSFLTLSDIYKLTHNKTTSSTTQN
jgi:hypothetical protein